MNQLGPKSRFCPKLQIISLGVGPATTQKLLSRFLTFSCCSQRSSFTLSSLATSFLVTLLAAAWVTMVIYGNEALGKSEWFDPASAIFLVRLSCC